MNLYQETINRLQTLKGQYRRISKETGLDYDWLCQVASQRISDPGVKKIERLNSHIEKAYPKNEKQS